MWPSVILLALALASAAATLAQSPATESQTGASRVALATVADPRGRALLDVSADDFVIQEAGAARDILSVRPADYPIVLMLDTGVDARGDLQMIRKAAAHFIERIGQRPVAIGTLGGAPALLTGLDDERETVMTTLAALDPPADAPSALMQGAALAAETIRKTGALFSAIIVLSSASLDASDGQPDAMIASIVDSNAILHVVARGSEIDSRARSSRDNRDVTPFRAIRALAEQSRGEFTTIYSAASFQAALDRLADRLTSELMIEYLVPVGSKPADVKVGIRIVGARVRGLGVAPK
jgi:hypothetical protein